MESLIATQADREAFIAYIERLDLATGFSYTFELVVNKEYRTLPQNALFKTWCREITRVLNKRNRSEMTEKQVEEKLVTLYLGNDPIITESSCSVRRIHLSRADKGDMSYLLDNVLLWAVDNEIDLPVPPESQYMKIKKKHLSGG